MNERSRSLFRVAGFLRQAVARRRQSPGGVWLPEQQWAECVTSLRRIRLATERGWHRAAAQTKGELLYLVEQCRTYLQDVSLGLQQLSSASKSPSEADIFRELVALEAEFDDIELDFENEELCITTPSVTLEGIYLGPFQIRLHWSQQDAPLSYHIVALEPTPAVSNESVTHPHVSDESLCEGDGRQAIRAALDDGRLADFFVLVWRILDSYSPGRAYIEMSEWFGASCHECGTHMHEDDRCSCSRCGELFCQECTHICPHCDDVYCISCISHCRACDGVVCGTCSNHCSTCEATVCPDCLSGELCSACRDAQDEESDPFDEAESPPPGGEGASSDSLKFQANEPALHGEPKR